MNDKIIKVQRYTDIESLKKYILQKLKLVDHKKDSVSEFYDRLKNCLNRDRDLKITFQLDRDKLEEDIRFELSLATRGNQPYPDNFEMGNPHNRWFFDPIVRTEEEAREKKVEFEKSLQDKLMELRDFFDRLEKLGAGQICVQDQKRY